MHISIETLGIDVTRSQVEALKQRPEAEQVWSTIAQIMRAETLRNFQEERAPDGRGWRPLSPQTIKRRRSGPRSGGGHRILQDSGRLRGSIAANHGAGWAECGTNIKYGPTHQFGSRKRNIPARAFVGLSKSMNERINVTMRKWLNEGV